MIAFKRGLQISRMNQTMLTRLLPSILFAFFIIACNKPGQNIENQNHSPAKTVSNVRVFTAKGILEAFQKAGIPIGSVIYYTAENDSNNLLGRPHQYVEKASWADTRIKQEPDYNPEHRGSKEDLDPEGGTVEIFSTADDLENRRQYIEAVSAKMSPLAQYIYSHGNALVRLEKQLTPSQAAEYERALRTLQ